MPEPAAKETDTIVATDTHLVQGAPTPLPFSWILDGKLSPNVLIEHKSPLGAPAPGGSDPHSRCRPRGSLTMSRRRRKGEERSTPFVPGLLGGVRPPLGVGVGPPGSRPLTEQPGKRWWYVPGLHPLHDCVQAS